MSTLHAVILQYCITVMLIPYRSLSLDKLKLFERAVRRPTRKDLTAIRVKEVFRCQDVEQIFERLSSRVMKGQGGRSSLAFTSSHAQDGQHFSFIPRRLVVVKTVKRNASPLYLPPFHHLCFQNSKT